LGRFLKISKKQLTESEDIWRLQRRNDQKLATFTRVTKLGEKENKKLEIFI